MHITPNRIQFPFSKINNDVQHFLFRTIIVSPVVQFPSAVPLLPLPLIEFSLQSAGCLSPTFSPFPPRFLAAASSSVCRDVRPYVRPSVRPYVRTYVRP